MKAFGIGAALVGLLLLVLSTFWVSIYPSSWTPEKAKHLATATDRLHNLSFTVSAPPGSEPPRRHASREEAKKEYDRVKETAIKLQAEFESAYQAPRTMASIMKWSGIALLAVGAVGAYAAANKR